MAWDQARRRNFARTDAPIDDVASARAGGSDACRATLLLLPARIQLHQPVQELVAFVERAHADALVQAVHAGAVRVAEHAVYSVGRYAGIDCETAVRGRGQQLGQ